MQSQLIDVVFRSKKRRDLLLLLGNGPRTIDNIKTLLDVSATSILPQIKKLTDSNLVIQSNGQYELTDTGELAVKKVRPLINILSLLEKNDFWLEHDLSAIPRYLQDRIGELKDCRIVESEPSQIFEPRTEVLDFISESRSLLVFSSFFRPEFLSLYSKLGRAGAEVSLIFTESVLDKTLHNYERKIKRFVELKNTELFVCKDGVKLGELIVSERGILLSLFTPNGRFHHDYVLCFEEEALQWGQDLFEFYKGRAQKIEKGQSMEEFSGGIGNSFLSKSSLLSIH